MIRAACSLYSLREGGRESQDLVIVIEGGGV
jgi:hypothetical protein